MAARILDGTATARAIRQEIAAEVARLRETAGRPPTLAAVLIGDDPASHTYVGMKQRACAAAGMESQLQTLPADASQAQAEELVARLNADPAVDGILVQHPLPKQLDELAVLDHVAPEKDVDGISAASLGALLQGEARFIACTPLGIMELLWRHGVEIEGKRAVVVGRSIILGKPMALSLLNAHATVTVCHSRTRDLADEIRRADLLVAAIGKAEFITGEMIKDGAVVVDAGYNRVPGRTGDVGDVEFAGASARAAWITPVPGGVGPMTIAMLLSNTVKAFAARTRSR